MTEIGDDDMDNFPYDYWLHVSHGRENVAIGQMREVNKFKAMEKLFQEDAVVDKGLKGVIGEGIKHGDIENEPKQLLEVKASHAEGERSKLD
ncbi:hypothetical protein RJT34_05216 [Clitoria ternatea]|uniref:Uncharacterized protein n=1 Tax=Clitoria ternatea TaxID=43366 RepID=A0AAN9K2V1_CLITE